MPCLLHFRNVILADEMGLGKTVQCIGLLSIISALGVEGPHLVVVPLSTIANWLREFEKWAPTLNVIVYIGDGDSRKEIRHHEWVALQRSIVLTTYDMVTRDSAVFKEEKWRHLIVDEAHRYAGLVELWSWAMSTDTLWQTKKPKLNALCSPFSV